MPDTKFCAECESPLPAYWPKGLCAQCALDGALDMTNASSQVRQAETLLITPADLKPPGSGPVASPLGSFGDYDLLDEIARGGMGVVYKARQKNLGRIVAVKLILAGPQAGKDFVRRFRTESAAAATLQHPNIVAIHDVGVHDGRHYFSMDFVEGQNLAQLVGQQPLPPAKAARYVELIAAAIHYAHERGILHRDLKPSNVLIDANDQPRITDFGLAKRLDGDSSLTLTGQVLGSPNFMPPEQAGGGRGKVGRPSDVYALGGILYYLLTARAPFQAESLEQIISQVVNADPVPPRLLNPSIARDLETITLKCLEKEPSRRYQTAQELADELGRVLRHEPIQARPVNAPEKLWRWCRRKPALASAVGLAIAVLLIGFATTTWQWRRAERHAESERHERERAEAQAYASDMKGVQQALADHDLGRARQLLDRHRPRERPESRTRETELPKDQRGWEWRYLWDRSRGEMEFTLHEQAGLLFYYAGFLNDGTRVATFDKTGRVSLWDLATRTQIRQLQGQVIDDNQPDNSGQANLSQDGELLAARSRDENGKPSIKVWKTATGEVMAEFPCERSWVTALTFSPNKQKLAAFILPEGVRVWNLSAGKELMLQLPVAPHAQFVRYSHGAVRFSPDGALLAIGDGDGRVRLIDVATGKESAAFKASIDGIFTLAFSPDGRVLAAGAAFVDPEITVWDVPNRTNRCRLPGHNGWVASLAFSPDGKTLASASGDGMIKLWDTTTWGEERTLVGHREQVWSVAFSKDGQRLVSAGTHAVNIWSTAKGRPSDETLSVPASANLPASAIESRWDISPDGTTLAVVGPDGITRLRDAVSGEKKLTLSALGTNNVAIFWSPAGEILAGSREPSEIKVWNLARSTLTTHPLSLETPPSRWLFLPKTGTILFGCTNAGTTNWTFSRWDVRARREVSPRLTVNKDVGDLAVSADEDLLVIGTWRGEVSLLNLKTGREEAPFTAHAMKVQGLALSPDGKLLVTASQEAPTVKVWDLAARKVVITFRAHNLGILRIAISPDGSRMVTTTIGREPMKIWDTRSWEQVANIGVNGSTLRRARFLPDGNTLAAMDANQTLHLWRVPSWAEIETAEKAQANSR